MQKKSENVAHAADGIKLKNLKNSVDLWNSPPTGSNNLKDTCQEIKGGAFSTNHIQPGLHSTCTRFVLVKGLCLDPL
jgi:hypothetical protein